MTKRKPVPAAAPPAAMLFRGESAAELLPIGLLRPWAGNPRRSRDEGKLQELVASVGKLGILQPLLVRPLIGEMERSFEVICGSRRLRAAQLAGLEYVPAVVRDLLDHEALELAVTENLQREDVPPLDEAEGYETLRRRHGYPVDEIAERVGKSRTYVYARLKLTDLCEEAREYLRDGRISTTVALLVARLPVPSDQVKAAALCVGDDFGQVSATTAQQMIRQRFMLRLDRAKFPTDDAELCQAAGSCTECPKRTGNQPELFGDIAEAETCTDSQCYEGKTAAAHARTGADYERRGVLVLRGEVAHKAVFGRDSEWVRLRTLCPADHGRGDRSWGELWALAGHDKPDAAASVNSEWHEMAAESGAKAALQKLGIETAPADAHNDDEPWETGGDAAPDAAAPERQFWTQEQTRAVHAALEKAWVDKPALDAPTMRALLWLLLDYGVDPDSPVLHEMWPEAVLEDPAPHWHPIEADVAGTERLPQLLRSTLMGWYSDFRRLYGEHIELVSEMAAEAEVNVAAVLGEVG